MPRTFPLYQVDAFTNHVFGGNPASVVALDTWLPDETLLAITQENNQSETAFFVPQGHQFELRWFTSQGEIDLCGHATLATAHVIVQHRHFTGTTIHFTTRQSGDLFVRYDDGTYTLDFPERIPVPTRDYPQALIKALGGPAPIAILKARDYVLVYSCEEDIRGLRPDFSLLHQLSLSHGPFYVSVTAPGRSVDFVSRFFCPGDAVPEDPVTGSAHCHLIPYWATILGKKELMAHQLSPRGGAIVCQHGDGRVYMSGQAVTYLSGTISLS